MVDGRFSASVFFSLFHALVLQAPFPISGALSDFPNLESKHLRNSLTLNVYLLFYSNFSSFQRLATIWGLNFNYTNFRPLRVGAIWRKIELFKYD